MPTADTIERNEEIVTMIERGETVLHAIEVVAAMRGLSTPAVTTAYYQWRKREIAAGRKFPKPSSSGAVSKPGHAQRAEPAELEPNANGDAPSDDDALALALRERISMLDEDARLIAEQRDKLCRAAALLGVELDTRDE